MRKRILWTTVAALTTAVPVAAQQSQGRAQARSPEARVPGVARNIQTALEHAEALGLSAEQVQALEEMRTDLSGIREELGQESRAVRERVRDLDAEAREARRRAAAARREAMEELRSRHQEALAPLQERYDGVLSVEERARLRGLVRQELRQGRGAVRGGRRDLRRGRAIHPGSRGLRPGAGPGGVAGPGGRARLDAFRGDPGAAAAWRRGVAVGMRRARLERRWPARWMPDQGPPVGGRGPGL